MEINPWHCSEHDDEPRDQDRDMLIPHLFAEVGPDAGGWSWAVVMFGEGGVVAGQFVSSEQEAKDAVDHWEDENFRCWLVYDEETGYVREVLPDEESALRYVSGRAGKFRVEGPGDEVRE